MLNKKPIQSAKYNSLYVTVKNTELTSIFLEKDNNKDRLVYLAGIVDNSGDLEINYKQHREVSYRTYRYNGENNDNFTLEPLIEIINRSVELSKWLKKHYFFLGNPAEDPKISLNGKTAYLFVRDLYPFLINKKMLADTILKFGELKKWENLNWNDVEFFKGRSYEYLYSVEIDHKTRPDLKLAIDFRYLNTERIGVKEKDLLELLNKYEKINHRKYVFKPPEIDSRVKLSNEELLLYLAGNIDSDVSSIGFYKNGSNKNPYFPQIKIKNKSYLLKFLIANKYKKQANESNPLKLLGKDALDIILKIYPKLILNKRKADYIHKFNSIESIRGKISIVIEFKEEFPFEKGNAKKSLIELKKYCKQNNWEDFVLRVDKLIHEE